MRSNLLPNWVSAGGDEQAIRCTALRFGGGNQAES